MLCLSSILAVHLINCFSSCEVPVMAVDVLAVNSVFRQEAKIIFDFGYFTNGGVRVTLTRSR